LSAKFLLIEDHPDNRKLMVYLLEKFGHDVRTADTGEEGLVMAMTELFDLVICDIELPGIDGCEVTRRLKSNSQWRRVPLIAVTALAMVGDRERILRCGFDGYLSKPISPKSFTKQIESYLQSGDPHPDALQGQPDSQAVHSIPSAIKRIAPRILIIENHPANQKLMKYLLEKSGYEVTLADTGEEGIGLAQGETFDLILCDIYMTGIDGCEVARRMKADPKCRWTPLVAVTAMTRPSDRDQVLAAGFDGYVPKAIAPKQFIAQIQSFLRGDMPNPIAAESH
jgi:two-component system cell cycle response regulator